MEKFSSDVLKATGVQLTRSQVHTFLVYEHELLEWNERFNLTAIRDSEGIRTKHFLDSISCINEINSPPGRLIDIGTGAGFPGIPLKILYPSMHLTLVESVGKKADFCKMLAAKLELINVEVLSKRAEEMGQDSKYREQYDWAVARAVAAMPVLSEYLLPLVRVGGAMLAQKGENAYFEVQTAEKAIKMLGGTLRHISRVILPGIADERYLVVIAKSAATPLQYPRRTGVPQKKPL